MNKFVIFAIIIFVLLLLFITSFVYDPYSSVTFWNPVVKYFGTDRNLDGVMEYLDDNKDIFIEEFLLVQKFHEERIKPTSSINDHEKVLAGHDFEKWRTAPVRYLKNWRNPDIFPGTIEILNQYDDIISTAYFSVMEPGKFIPFHYGIYAGIQRLHIPLIVPPGNTSLELLDGTINRWCDGPFWFHDYEYHRAWNLTEGQRVVFIIDFIMDLPPGIEQINNLMFKAATMYADRTIS
jgi:aspartyl/asparaginyl beta-hydroxylase (cupin superfamily)